MADIILRPPSFSPSSATQASEWLTDFHLTTYLPVNNIHFVDNLRFVTETAREFSQSSYEARLASINHDRKHACSEEGSKMVTESLLEESIRETMRMICEGVYVSRYGLLDLIRRCINEENLQASYDIHFILVLCGLESDAFIGNHLIRMFGMLGCVPKANQMFQKLLFRDVFSWTALIYAYANMGNYLQAIQLYEKMKDSGFIADGHLFVAVLQACSCLADLEHGCCIHSDIIESGLEAELYVASALVDMYNKCGNLDMAKHAFEKLPRENVVMWSILIKGYLEHGYDEMAISLFKRMQQEHIEPNIITCTSAVNACAQLGTGRQIHAIIVGHGLESDTIVGTALINMYSKCASLTDATAMFCRLENKEEFMWSSLIANYCEHEHDNYVPMLFGKMQKMGIKPSAFTFIKVLKACAKLGDLADGMIIHTQIVENELESDVYVCSSLIDMYAKCGNIKDAQAVFDRSQEHNIVTWSAMISGFCQHGYGKEAFQHYERMKQEGLKPNDFTLVSMLKACSSLLTLEKGMQIHMNCVEYGSLLNMHVGNTLIDMYAKCGSLQDVYKIFNKLTNRDVVTWSSLIAACVLHQECQAAIQHYASMQKEGIEPNIVTFTTLLKACSTIAALEHGRLFHLHIINNGFILDAYVGSAIIDMYAKSGCLEDACIIFQSMPQQDTVIWSAMINGFAQHNDYDSARRYFDAMLQANVKPDSITFLNVLSACSNALLVEEGCYHLRSMIEVHNTIPEIEHLNCMIDLLGNANLLNEAMDLLETVPFRYNVVGWMALLSSCRMHADVDIGRICFDYIVTMDKGNVACYALMSDIYSSTGMRKHARMVEELRLHSNSWKKPGKSYIEINNEIHSFLVGDKKHQQTKKIYAKLRDLDEQMKKAGHRSYTDSAIGEDDLCGHCEKLAIAFGLVCTPEGTTIRVSKHLRMCSVCHTDTGFISKAVKREIIVVDSRCVHTFQNGLCACNMYR